MYLPGMLIADISMLTWFAEYNVHIYPVCAEYKWLPGMHAEYMCHTMFGPVC